MRLMSPHPPTTFRVDPGLLAAMHELKERDGIPISEQVRRAIRMWLEAKGGKIKTAPRRVSPRRKA